MAIALDANSTGVGGTATPQTWTHTCTGSNLMLIVNVYSNTPSDVTGVTYNGVAMTSLGNYSYSGVEGNLWYLINPATGANTVSIAHTSTSNFVIGVAASYTGVKQSAQPDSSLTTQTTASATTLTATNTVVAAGSWLITGGINNSGGALIAGTGGSIRRTGSNVAVSLFDSGGPVTAGAKSMTIKLAAANAYALGMVSIAPVTAVGVVEFGHSSTKSSAGSGVTSTSWAHDCTGDNYLLVGLTFRPNVSSITITYNGTNMSLLDSASNTFEFQYLYGLASPTTGSNTIAVNWTTSSQFGNTAASFANVTSAGTTSKGTASGAGTVTGSSTITATGMVAGVFGIPDGAGNTSVITGTEQGEVADGTFILGSMGTNVGSGSVSVSWSYLGSDASSWITVPLNGSVVVATNSGFLMFM